MSNKQLEEKVTELEGRIKDLESNLGTDTHTKWKVILLLGVWAIAAVFGFTQIGTENMKEVISTAGLATFVIVVLF